MLVMTVMAQEDALRRFLDQPLELRLFQNDISPNRSTAIEQFSEADFIGYGTAILSDGWKVEAGTATYPQQIFQSTAQQFGQQVYGYFVNRLDGSLMWSERFADGPYFITNLEDAIKVIPALKIS